MTHAMMQVYHEESGYYYNAAVGWYYDVASAMYYGGQPPDWTYTPNISKNYLFCAQADDSQRNTATADGAKANSEQVATVQQTADTGVQPKTKLSKYPPGLRVQHSHPLSGIGGYQMPTSGTIASLRTSGGVEKKSKENGSKAREKMKGPTKGDAKSSKVSKEEQEALARREAARKRVEKRTMAAFGLQ